MRPPPVAYSDATVPRTAGLRTELQQPVSFSMAACPLPNASKVYTAGALAVTANLTGGERLPWYSTTTSVVFPAATPSGTMAATWPLAEYTTCASALPKNTRVSPIGDDAPRRPSRPHGAMSGGPALDGNSNTNSPGATPPLLCTAPLTTTRANNSGPLTNWWDV